ncbi:ribosomal RNA large subunit methyltransferase N [Cutibacterium acnes JCM 18909]|nr:ribosomal RNA large subunit methyltransferase N [Cutibacterium acnes JCM 18909]
MVNTPSRAKPPRHWIDLSIEERVQAVKDLGVPAFRARQISAHVFLSGGRSTRLSGLTCLRRLVRRSPTPGFRSC